MTQQSFQRVFCLLTCFVWASPPLRPQAVISGGTTVSPSAVVDFTNAGQTIPARKVASDPSTCTVGEQYFNTTSNVLKVCTATNTWTTSSAPPGASGGVPYYSSASALASSSMLNANSVVVGGGAGAAPKASGVTIDASNNLSTPGTLSTGSGGSSHGKLALGELPANGAQTVGWEAPDSITSSLSLMFPNTNPTANSFLGFPAPTAGVAQGSWFTFGTNVSVAGTVVDVNTGTIVSHSTNQAGTDTTVKSASASSTTYTGAMNPTLTAYSEGQHFTWIPDVNCGASPSLNIGGLGPIPLKKILAGALIALTTSDCVAKVPYMLRAHSTTPPTVDAFVVTTDTPTGAVKSTGLTAAVGTTNLQCGGTICAAGVYRISFYDVVSTPGTGTLQTVLGWNDGTAARTITSTGIAATATNFEQNTYVIMADGVNNITYSTIFGTGTYKLNVILEQLQ